MYWGGMDLFLGMVFSTWLFGSSRCCQRCGMPFLLTREAAIGVETLLVAIGQAPVLLTDVMVWIHHS